MHSWVVDALPGIQGLMLMDKQDAFDMMTDACIEAGHLVMANGSPELQAAMMLALFVLGRELARGETPGASDAPKPVRQPVLVRRMGKRVQ